MKEKFRIFAALMLEAQKVGRGYTSPQVNMAMGKASSIPTHITIYVGAAQMVIFPDGTWEILL